MPDTVTMTAVDVLRFAPSAKPDIVAALAAGGPRFGAVGITSPLRLPHFMAQIATETGGFTIYTENMNYSAPRLTQVWPSQFPTIAAAAPYANSPAELADYIYADANRPPGYKLGNTQPGDGWRYRGRGLIQTTGRDAYRTAGHEADPEALNDPAVGLATAIAEFINSGCLPLADKDDVESVRRRINGGLTGIDDCRQWLAKAKVIWGASSPASPEPWAAPGWQLFKDPRLAWSQSQINHLYPGSPTLVVDGLAGPNTAIAVRAFQRDHGLTVDGIVGPATTDALKAAVAAEGA